MSIVRASDDSCNNAAVWCRIMDLDPALPDVAKTAGLSPPPPDH